MRARGVAAGVATVALVGGAIAVGAVAVPTIASAVALETPSAARPVVTVTVTVPAPAASTATTPAAAYRGPLVATTGAQVRTRAELHAWVRTRSWALQDPANAAVWEQQAWLDIGCMARAGFLYDPITNAEQDAEGVGLTDAQRAAYAAALYGPPTSAPYDWRTAGCHGRSVHLTGQDDAH